MQNSAEAAAVAVYQGAHGLPVSHLYCGCGWRHVMQLQTTCETPPGQHDRGRLR